MSSTKQRCFTALLLKHCWSAHCGRLIRSGVQLANAALARCRHACNDLSYRLAGFCFRRPFGESRKQREGLCRQKTVAVSCNERAVTELANSPFLGPSCNPPAGSARFRPVPESAQNSGVLAGLGTCISRMTVAKGLGTSHEQGVKNAMIPIENERAFRRRSAPKQRTLGVYCLEIVCNGDDLGKAACHRQEPSAGNVASGTTSACSSGSSWPAFAMSICTVSTVDDPCRR